MRSIEVECPKCETVFAVDDFDETKEIEDTTCVECGADLEISEYDPITGDYCIEDVSESVIVQDDLDESDDALEEAEEEAGLIVTDDKEDEEDEES